MTLEQLGFEMWYTNSAFGFKSKVYYRRLSFFETYYELIKFDLNERAYELTNIAEVDMDLNDAIQNKLKELELI